MLRAPPGGGLCAPKFEPEEPDPFVGGERAALERLAVKAELVPGGFDLRLRLERRRARDDVGARLPE